MRRNHSPESCWYLRWRDRQLWSTDVSGSEVVSATILIQKNEVSTTKQPSDEIKLAPKLTPENTKINWNASLEDIYNHIRGLNPFPSAWSEIVNDNHLIPVKIYKIKKGRENHHLANGAILITKKELKVAVTGGYIIIEELKLSERKMEAKILNGFHFSPNAKCAKPFTTKDLQGLTKKEPLLTISYHLSTNSQFLRALLAQTFIPSIFV